MSYSNTRRYRKSGLNDCPAKRTPQLTAVEHNTKAVVLLRKDDDDFAAAAAPSWNNNRLPPPSATTTATTKTWSGQSPRRSGGRSPKAVPVSMETTFSPIDDAILVGYSDQSSAARRGSVLHQLPWLAKPPDYECSSFCPPLRSQQPTSLPALPPASKDETTDDDDDGDDDPRAIAASPGGECHQLLLFDVVAGERVRRTSPSIAERASRRRSAPTLHDRSHRKFASSPRPTYDLISGSTTNATERNHDAGLDSAMPRKTESFSLSRHRPTAADEVTRDVGDVTSPVVYPSSENDNDMSPSTFLEDVAAVRRLLLAKTATSGSTSTMTKHSSSSSISSTPRRNPNRLIETQRSDSVMEVETVL